MAVALRMQMKPYCAPDDDLELVAVSTTTTAASTNYTAIDLGSNMATIKRPQVALSISAIDSGTGDESYTVGLYQSSDNFATAGDLLGQVVIASAAANDLDDIVNHQVCFGTTQIEKRYIRLQSALSGTTPSITFGSYLGAY